jgi:hypothetical protein
MYSVTARKGYLDAVVRRGDVAVMIGHHSTRGAQKPIGFADAARPARPLGHERCHGRDAIIKHEVKFVKGGSSEGQ